MLSWEVYVLGVSDGNGTQPRQVGVLSNRLSGWQSSQKISGGDTDYLEELTKI